MQSLMPRPAVLLMVLASLHIATADHADPAAYAQYLTDNKASAIVSDDIQAQISPPRFTGYAAINEAVPTHVWVACHPGPEPYPHPGSASNSTSARKYVSDIAFIVGDGYQAANQIQPKQDYNQSWALGLVWGGMYACIFHLHMLFTL